MTTEEIKEKIFEISYFIDSTVKNNLITDLKYNLMFEKELLEVTSKKMYIELFNLALRLDKEDKELDEIIKKIEEEKIKIKNNITIAKNKLVFFHENEKTVLNATPDVISEIDNLFKEFLKDKNIMYHKDFTKEDFNEFMFIKSLYYTNRISEFKDMVSKTKLKSINDDEISKNIDFFEKRITQLNNDINTINKQTETMKHLENVNNDEIEQGKVLSELKTAIYQCNTTIQQAKSDMLKIFGNNINFDL